MERPSPSLTLALALAVTGLGIGIEGCGRISFESTPGADDGGAMIDAAEGPVLALTSPALVVSDDGSASFEGTCSRPTDVEVTGETPTTIACDGVFRLEVTIPGSGRFEWALRPAGFPAAAPLEVTVVRDLEAPTIDYLRIGSSALTRVNVIPVDLGARDATTFVAAFCLSFSVATAPASDDACWTPVNAPSPGLVPGPELTLESFPFTLGFGAGTYQVRGWVRDEAGNVSESSAVIPVEYLPGQPPLLTDVMATATGVPVDPPTAADLRAPRGTPLHIKWSAEDDEPLPSSPVSVYYTTDEENFVLVAEGLVNGANGGCTVDSPGTTVDDGATGCYLWASGPTTDGYLRIRVVVEDALTQRTAGTSPPLNADDFHFIAGNTDPGTGASGRAALFFGAIHSTSQDYPGVGNMAVTEDGRLLFRDIHRGILIVDPGDGIQRVLVPTTGASTGDGGPSAAATLRMPLRIALGAADELYIFDYDRIRRISLDAPGMPIEHVIGGGPGIGDGVGPDEVLITPPSSNYDTIAGLLMAFVALPNGDVWFQSEAYSTAPSAGHRIRVYDASAGTVSSVVVTGTAEALAPGLDVNGCNVRNFGLTYDIVTSEVTHAQVAVRGGPAYVTCTIAADAAAILRVDSSTGSVAALHPTPFEDGWTWHMLSFPVQGRDGKLYLVRRNRSVVQRYDAAADAYEDIAGTGTRGRCPDGTPALACDMDPIDVFVGQGGRVWLLDLDRIRVIDEDGNLRTVMGQPLDFGDGERPESARFSELTGLAHWDDGSGSRFTILDQDVLRFREVGPGPSVRTIAGNGSAADPNPTTAATAQGLRVFSSGGTWPNFSVDPSDGAVWFSRGRGYVAILDRATDRWVDQVGGGAVPYYDAAAASSTGSEIDLTLAGFTSYPPMVLGLSETTALVHKSIYTGATRTHIQSRLLEVDRSTGSATSLMGTAGAISTMACTDSTRLDACALPLSNGSLGGVWDAYAGGRWIWARRNQGALRTLDGGTLGTLGTLANTILGFDYRRDGAADEGTAYTCGTDGNLHVFDVATAVERTVALPSPTMRCSGPVTFVAARGSLVFGFEQNGVGGVAEYLSP